MLKRQRWSRGLAGGGERDYANANAVANETMAAGGGINGLPGANGRALATSWEEAAEYGSDVLGWWPWVDMGGSACGSVWQEGK